MKTITKIIKAFYFKKKFPLAVTWNITYRCNLQCQYCNTWRKNIEELPTTSVLSMIKQLVASGTQYIDFSGGEPLVREDLKEIIQFCHKHKITTGIKTNGTLLSQNIDRVKDADKIQISLDGPEPIQDQIRGKGVYQNVIAGIETCKANNLDIGITTVISKYNVSKLTEILKFAAFYKLPINFQPVNQNLSGGNQTDISPYFPDESEFKNAIHYLLEEKKKGNTFIQNSNAALNHLLNWPQLHEQKCYANHIFCMIEPNGKIFVCDIFPEYSKYLISAENHFQEAFSELKLPHPCPGCWVNTFININLLGNGHFKAIPEILKLLKKKL